MAYNYFISVRIGLYCYSKSTNHFRLFLDKQNYRCQRDDIKLHMQTHMDIPIAHSWQGNFIIGWSKQGALLTQPVRFATSPGPRHIYYNRRSVIWYVSHKNTFLRPCNPIPVIVSTRISDSVHLPILPPHNTTNGSPQILCQPAAFCKNIKPSAHRNNCRKVLATCQFHYAKWQLTRVCQWKQEQASTGKIQIDYTK